MAKLFCTVLGCGTSAGVPSLGFGWGACDKDNPKNRRMRCSLLLQWREGEEAGSASENKENKNSLLRSVLIDSSPDCREQLMGVGLQRLDAVLYTHEHADHCHGIDDLKWMCEEKPLTAYATHSTLTSLTNRFGYIFSPKDNLSLYRPVLRGRTIVPFRSFCPIEDAEDARNEDARNEDARNEDARNEDARNEDARNEGARNEDARNEDARNEVTIAPQILPIALEHGFTTSVLGFRIGNFAYTTDCVDLSERAFAALSGVRYWVVGCLRREEHPTHAHLARVISWVERLDAKMVYLTHMNGSMDYASLCAELPEHIRPAYDFLRIQAEFP